MTDTMNLARAGAFSAALLALGGLPAAAADAPIHIEVSLGDVSLNKVPFIIAADAGIYAKNGLEVHQFITPGAAKAVVGNGIIVPPEYIGEGGQNAPIGIGGGAPLVFSAGRSNAKPHRVIIATTENIVRDHILTRPDIQTEQDLAGKKLGAGLGNVPGFAAIVYVKKLNLQNVTITRDANIEALKAGTVDAIMGNLFDIAEAPEKGLKDLVDLSKYNIPEAGSGVSVDPVWLAANRDTAAKFIKSMVEGTARMKKDKKIFAATLAKWFNVKDPAMVDRLFAQAQTFPDKPYPSVEGIKMAMQVYDSPTMQTYKPEEFYDSSFIADLDKSGYLDKISK